MKVSQRALQKGSSFPCQMCVAGFCIGISLTTLFLAALTSRGTFAFIGIPFSAISYGVTSWNSSSDIINMVTRGDCDLKPTEIENVTHTDQQTFKNSNIDERVSFLYSAWSVLLNESMEGEGESPGRAEVRNSNVPKAPHLEDCKLSVQINKNLDKHVANESSPPWTLWKGFLDTYPSSMPGERLKSEGAYPPWITGSDEENYPFTRKVQRDIWMHQHPPDCNDPNVKFLVVNWETSDGLGMGGQLNSMAGNLAIAIGQKRVLVTNYYNRADHDGCRGPSHSSWSCYFFPETSQECRDRALQLRTEKEAWEKGIITGKDNYTESEKWFGQPPRQVPEHIHYYFLHKFRHRVRARAVVQQPKLSADWGDPWIHLQPTTDINRTLIGSHHAMDRRWWRAQAVRYLMRFQTEYTCNLLNAERHAAFGWEAAKMVLAASANEWLEEVKEESHSDMEQFVWSNHKPWMPRPLLSIHVRMGDKASEMELFEFEDYMDLAQRIRRRFPHLNSIWLSTEMQEVIDSLRSYPNWRFYYTNVTRQVGNTSMAAYTASLGRETGTNYPLVNFLMAAESDFFIGALGSTWCFLIDGMRNTGGKVMAGYLSVNKDRYW